MPLVQFTYSSSARVKFDETELENLVEHFRLKNSLRGVTGLLLYHKRCFLQILEGEEEPVTDTFERIARDTRHTDLLLLLRNYVKERSFRDWSMGFVNTRRSAGKMAGFDDIIAPEDSLLDLGDQPNKVVRILEAFRDPEWRKAVSI